MKMKALKFIFIATFVITVFVAKDASAQAIVTHDDELTFYVPHPNRNDEKKEFVSISSRTTITPAGNIVKTATFQLPEDNFLVPEKGTKTIIITRLDVAGVKLSDERVDIKKSGKFKVTFHMNGAGTASPKGWIIPDE